MDLDVPTLMFLGGLVAFASGGFLLLHWAQDRSSGPALLWGLANTLMGIGVLILALAPSLSPVVVTAFTPLLLHASAAMTWFAARRFGRHAGETGAALLVVAVWTAADWLVSRLLGEEFAEVVGAFIAGSFFAASALELWRLPLEGTRNRLPLVLLLGLEACGLWITAVAITLSDPGSALVGGWHGLIHFIAPIYAVGSAVWVVALLREQVEEALRKAASIDSLTGLLNRGAFLEKAARLHRRVVTGLRPVSVLVLDLDHFKGINDRFGHAVGDGVLATFAAVLGKALRPTDIAGRIGGEEFAAIVPGDREVAAAIARRIRDGFEREARFVGTNAVGATVSIGIASTRTSRDLPALMVSADQALYRAKAAGRNRLAHDDEGGDAPGSVVRVA